MHIGNYIPLYTNLPGHPKFKHLCRLLKKTDEQSRLLVLAQLASLWMWVLDYWPEGFISADPDVIADESKWREDPQEWTNALVKSGFLEKEDKGYRVHSWEEYAGRLLEKRKQNAERMRTTRAKKPEDPPQESRAEDVQRTCETRAGLKESKGEERINSLCDEFILSFPLKDSDQEWNLSKGKFEEFKQTYPGMDVLAESRKARQWLYDHPEGQKTSRGMTRYLSGWLSRSWEKKTYTPIPTKPDSNPQSKVVDRYRKEIEERIQQLSKNGIARFVPKLFIANSERQVPIHSRNARDLIGSELWTQYENLLRLHGLDTKDPPTEKPDTHPTKGFEQGTLRMGEEINAQGMEVSR